MPVNGPKIKALALISLGLDSLLAARLVQQQGIDVHGIHFYARFICLDPEARLTALRNCLDPMSIPYEMVDYSEALRDILLNPDHGYGSQVNPCIDCRLLSLRLAYERMKSMDARFLITGEVVGQRPMTQNKPTLSHIDKVSGLKGLILRPLSAKLLPPSLPEIEGWIDRAQCLDVSGRSRKVQLQMAEALQLPCIPQPAGGCVLTDVQFSKRLKPLLAKLFRKPEIDELIMLRLGRHVWPNPHLQVIVGRHKENALLDRHRKGYWAFYPENGKGPLVLASEIREDAERGLVAAITSRYSGGSETVPVSVVFETPEGQKGIIRAAPVSETDLAEWRI